MQQAMDRLERMVEMLPLLSSMQELVGYSENFLQHFYSLQTFIYEKSTAVCCKLPRINFVPMNECWKAIMQEKNISETTTSNNIFNSSNASGIPLSAVSPITGVDRLTSSSAATCGLKLSEGQVEGTRIISNEGVVFGVVHVLRKLLEKAPTDNGESSIKLRVLLQLNILAVATKKSDIASFL